MRLSEHLDLSEVIRSESAKRNGISNMPTPEHIENFKILATKVFEPIREHFKQPITVSSAFRSLNLNQAVKGSITSQHCSGQAMDKHMGDAGKPSNKEIFDYIKKNIEFDQLIWEFGNDKNPSWVHVSYTNTKNRKQILKSVKTNGKTHYENL